MIQSVRRTMEILQYIAQNGNNVRLQDIAQSLQLEKTTVHNFLKSLTELGYIQQDKLSPRYQLSDKMHMLMPPEVSVVSLKQRFKPALEKIMERTGETSYLSVQMGSYIRHELKCDPDRRVRISLELGKDVTVMNSAIGNVFMAYSPHLRDHILRTLDDIEAEKLRKRLDMVAEKGYADDFERLEKELNCIALPVFDQKRLVAAIGVSGPAFRFTETQMLKAVEVIKDYL